MRMDRLPKGAQLRDSCHRDTTNSVFFHKFDIINHQDRVCLTSSRGANWAMSFYMKKAFNVTCNCEGYSVTDCHLRATWSMQIWTWEEISSRNPKVEASKNMQSGTKFLICFQKILALEILSKPTLLGSRRNSTGKWLNLLCWKNYIATLS